MRKIVLSLIVMLLAAFSAKALVYTVVVPEGTKACYLVGEMNGWGEPNGTNWNLPMEQDPEEPTIFTIDLQDGDKTFKYKYCCGPGWAYVEKNAEGGEIGDRSYPDDGMNIDFVETWAMVWDPDAVEKEFTLNVTVPEGTLAVYVNGTFTNWTRFERMQEITPTTYTLTVSVFADEVQYKYSSGPSWDYQELDEDGTSLSNNRSLTELESDDVVAMWEAIYEPPSEGITLNVTVPEGTNACYVAGNMNDWKQQLMTRVTATTYTITFDASIEDIEYKYCSGPDWKYEEVQADGNKVGNRKLNIADSPADDVVAKWALVYEPEFTLNVTVPEGTFACYVAGSMNDWKWQEMEKVDETTYTLTFTASSAEIEYKYCSGPGWDYEEQNVDGSWKGNRSLSITDSPSEDVVAKWKEVYASLAGVNVDNTFIYSEKAGLTVQFTGIAKIGLYNISGVLLKETIASGTFTQSDLAAGIYIVKVNNKAYKALVK